MEDREPPSFIVRVIGPLAFIISAIAALTWFGFILVQLLTNLASAEEIIRFDKGAFYMLGVGLGLATLAYVLVYELWYGKPLTEKSTKWCTKMAFISIVLLIVIPQIAHFVVGHYLTERGFVVCEDASSQWLFVKEIVYTQGSNNCELISKGS